MTSTYDLNGNRTSLAANIGGTVVNTNGVYSVQGGTPDFTNTYSYNNLGQMTSVQQTAQFSGNAVTTNEADFTYNANGLLNTVNRYQAGADVANSTYLYDHASRLTDLSYTDGQNNSLASYTWAYDNANRVTGYTYSSPSSTSENVTYSYKTPSGTDVNQLTSMTDSVTPSRNETFSYDANGNRTEGSYTTGADNELTSDGTYNYHYDAEGNCTWKYQGTWNSVNHRPSSNDAYVAQYTYDNRDRLTEAKVWNNSDYQGGAGTPDDDVTYTYDPFDRLIAKDQTVGGSVHERYVWDGQNMVLVLDGNAIVTERELYGPAVDQVLASENAAGTVSWLLADNEGTIRDVAQYTTGGGTSIVDHLVYDAFGNITSQTTGATTPRFTYTGQQYDAVTRLSYYRARWYDASTGRFMSQDPAGFSAGDANLYRYVGNDPVNFTDPSGALALPDSGSVPNPIGWQTGGTTMMDLSGASSFMQQYQSPWYEVGLMYGPSGGGSARPVASPNPSQGENTDEDWKTPQPIEEKGPPQLCPIVQSPPTKEPKKKCLFAPLTEPQQAQ